MAVFTVEDCATMRAPGRVLRRVDKLMSSYVESRFRGFDLTYAHWIALKVVRDGTVANAGELSRELGITTGATTRMIDALEQRGLMLRDRGTGDRRVVHLAVTDAGRETIRTLQGEVVAAWNEVLVDFSQEDADMMVDLLVRLHATAERVVRTGETAA